MYVLNLSNIQWKPSRRMEFLLKLLKNIQKKKRRSTIRRSKNSFCGLEGAALKWEIQETFRRWTPLFLPTSFFVFSYWTNKQFVGLFFWRFQTFAKRYFLYFVCWWKRSATQRKDFPKAKEIFHFFSYIINLNSKASKQPSTHIYTHIVTLNNKKKINKATICVLGT